MSSVTKTLQYMKQAQDLVSPEDSDTTRLTFRRFDGDALSKLAAGDISELSKNDIISITLAVNPEAVSYAQQRVTQKVPTTANGRFIIYDWGVDLLAIGISGNTGMLLPESITNPNDPTQNNFVSSIVQKVGAGNLATEFLNNSITNFLNYEEIIALSPKYQKFVQLQDMYRTFDGDRHILTMELGIKIYRGFFTNFSFDLIAASPYNYKYRIDFISLEELSAALSISDFSYDSSKISQEEDIPVIPLVP